MDNVHESVLFTGDRKMSAALDPLATFNRRRKNEWDRKIDVPGCRREISTGYPWTN